jgi:all-trans-retinol 13,14-reductase
MVLPQVEHFEVGSPVSNSYYIGSPRGEIYGLDHSVQRFGSPEVNMHLRPDTDIPGLLLTGDKRV